MPSSILQVNTTVATITTAGNVTYTVPQLMGGIIDRDPNGGNRTDTTPTAAQINKYLKKEGDTLICYLFNTSDANESITIEGGRV